MVFLVNSEGHLLLDGKYCTLERPNNNGISVITCENGKEFPIKNLLRGDGSLVSDDWFFGVKRQTNGYYIVWRESDLGYNCISDKGHIIANNWYGSVKSVARGFVKVTNEKDMVNFVDENTGELISDTWFLRAEDFSENMLSKVMKRNSNGVPVSNFLKPDGQVISEEWFVYDYTTGDGLFRVAVNDSRWNYIDINGKPISDEWFGFVGDFNCGFATVERNSDNMWNFMKRDGSILSDRWFKSVQMFRQNGKSCAGRVNIDDVWYSIDENGAVF